MNPSELFRLLEHPSTDHYVRLRCFWTAYYTQTTDEHAKHTVLFDIMKRFTGDILSDLNRRTYAEKTAFYNFAVQMFSEDSTLQHAQILAQYAIKLGGEFQKNAHSRIASCNSRVNFENVLFDLRTK